MELLFWSSLFLIVYAYAGYPLSLALLKRVKKKTFKIAQPDNEPVMSIIIAAANEESKIANKLDNTLALQYPYGKVEIIITLDGATDNTANIINQYINHNQHRRILLLENPKGGKEAAQLPAVQKATGDIFVFTDVATKLNENVLYQLASNFVDEQVGAVDGMSHIETEGSNEGIYLKYENKIREYESVLGSLVTMGGCLFAVRRKIVQNSHKTPSGRIIPGFLPDRQSDFRTALVTKTAGCDFTTALVTKTVGYQAVLDKNAIAVFTDTANPDKEFERKHRTVVRGLATFFDHLYLLNPRYYGIFSYQFFCHKLLKWLVPFFMIGAFISNVALIGSLVYTGLFIGQLFFYGIAVEAGRMLVMKGNTNKYAKIIYFFVMSNAAILKAWFSYAKGERYIMWEPTKR